MSVFETLKLRETDANLCFETEASLCFCEHHDEGRSHNITEDKFLQLFDIFKEGIGIHQIFSNCDFEGQVISGVFYPLLLPLASCRNSHGRTCIFGEKFKIKRLFK